MAFFSDEMAAMLETYQAEATDLMGIFDRLVLAGTQKNNFTTEEINEIFRTAHTIKSSSAMMGLTTLSSLTHTMEELFSIFRDRPEAIKNQVDSLTDLLYAYSDYVKAELSRMQAEDYAPREADALIASLKAAMAKFKRDSKTDSNVVATVEKEAAAQVKTAKQAEIIIRYTHDCAMVNVRSLVLLKQVSSKWHVASSEPADLQASGAPEIIKSQGFKLVVDTGDVVAVSAYLKRNPYVKDLVIAGSLHCGSEPKKDTIVSTQDQVVPESQTIAETSAEQTENQEEKEVDAVASAMPGALQSGGKQKEEKFVSLRWEDVHALQDIAGEFISLYSTFEQLEKQLPYTKELRHFRMTYGRLTNDFLTRVADMTMLQVSSLTPQLYRVVREMSHVQGKSIAFEVHGENIEIDRDLYDNISKPLLHILRNSIDHGIEKPEVRKQAGKNPRGKITLTVENQGARIVFRVTDDGKGMDPQAILAVAEKKGLLVKPAAEYTKQEALNLIMQPGFSTLSKATVYSGRGVGMDVVRTIADAFGGRVAIESNQGLGSSISMYMPVSVTAVASLSFRIGSWLCYLPLYSLDKIYGLEEALALMVQGQDDKLRINFGKKQILVLDLREKLQIEHGNGQFILVGHSLENYFAIIVDKIEGQVTAVNKPLPACLAKEWQLSTGIVNAVVQNDGSIGFAYSAAMLAALCNQGEEGAI